jgi:hypothetical protein
MLGSLFSLLIGSALRLDAFIAEGVLRFLLFISGYASLPSFFAEQKMQRIALFLLRCVCFASVAYLGYA